MKGIYCYVDKEDNTVVYVGQDSHIDENKRHRDHLKTSNYNQQQINRVLQNNPNRYTYQVLVFDVLDDYTLNALEIQYIRQLDPKFNFTEGGDGTTGYKHTDEWCQKQSERLTKRWEDDEYRKQNTGENHPMYGLRGEDNPNYGSKRTEEQKRNISEGHKKLWEDGDYRQKMSESWTDERRKQQSERSKEMWEDEEYRQKISQKHSERMKGKYIGENHPRAKYNLWDISSVHYSKRHMFQGGREPNPCKCFEYKYKGYRLPIGGFHDFVSVEIINDLVLEVIEEDFDD